MKLYIWLELNAIADHRTGMAFAHADTKQQAIKAVMLSMIIAMKQNLRHFPDSATWMRRNAIEIMKDMSKELRQVKPKVIECTEVFGLEVYGSA